MKKEKTVHTMESIIGKTAENRPHMVAAVRGDPDREIYSMSFRMPRETSDRLTEIARQRKISLQGLIAEYVDRCMREDNEGTFLPEGFEWPTKKVNRKGRKQ